MDTSNAGQCIFCSAPNSTCDMVQCDSCDQWAHYVCAGVTEAVKESDWICKKCNGELRVPKPKKSSKKSNSQKSKSDGGSLSGSIGSFDVQLKRLEEEQMSREKALEEEMILKERQMEMERKLKEMRRQKEIELQEKQLVQEREMRKHQLEEERKILGQRLAEEKAFFEERSRMHADFQKAKDNISRQYSKQEDEKVGHEKHNKEMAFDKKVEFWMNKQGESSKGLCSRN